MKQFLGKIIKNDKLFFGGMFLTLVVALALSIYENDWLTGFLTIIIAGLLFLPKLVQNKYDIYIPRIFSLAITFFIYATLFLGEIQDFYNRFWWWDMVLHAGSAIVIGLIGFVILLSLFKNEKVKASPFMIAVFSFCFAMSIGALWEIFEFFMDQTFSMNMQKSGLMDTMTDLIVDAIGALVAATIGYYYLTRNKKVPLGRTIENFVKGNK